MGYLNLDKLKQGERGVIYSVGGEISERLYALGIRSGRSVRFYIKSPLGDPCAYDFDGCIIALRKRDSEKILINLEE